MRTSTFSANKAALIGKSWSLEVTIVQSSLVTRYPGEYDNVVIVWNAIAILIIKFPDMRHFRYRVIAKIFRFFSSCGKDGSLCTR